MIITELPEEFLKATPIIEKIEARGFEAYFVGGSVRDIILHQPIHDVDIATSAFPEEIKQIFPNTIDVGIEHGTVLVLDEEEQYEITTFRTESTYQDYRRPDEVTFVRSLEEDLKRRDFTMNALAVGRDGEIVDLFSGIADIKKQQIVAVGNASERFHEDALRMMRGLRFSSQLNFSIEKNTKQAIQEHSHLLEKISIERIYIEFIKLLTSNYRNKGLKIFVETNCYRYCPGLEDKKEALDSLLLIKDKHVFSTEELAWLVLTYVLDIKEVKSFMKKWKTSNKLMAHIDACLMQLKKRDTSDWETLSLYESGSDVIQDVERARQLLGKESREAASLTRYESLPIHSIRDLEITGKELLSELNKEAGPWVGDLLKELEKKVVLRQLPNEATVLLKAAKERMEGR